MGVKPRGGSSNSLYLGIYDGSLVLSHMEKDQLIKLVERVDGYEDDIKSRKITKGKNEGKDLYYYEVFSIEGSLSDAEIRQNDWGDTLRLTFDDIGEKMVVDLGDVTGGYVQDLVRRMENVDVKKPMTFNVWAMDNEANGRVYHNKGVTIIQDEKKVEYTLTNKDLPAPKERKRRGGKSEWDWAEREDFIYEMAEKFVKSVKDSDTPPPPAKKKKAEKAVEEDDGPSDLPF